MNPHLFLFTPTNWHGSGEIIVALTHDLLPFTVQWQVNEKRDGLIEMMQLIKIEGVPETRRNRFRVFDLTESTFSIELEAPLIGKVQGAGSFDATMLRWAFHEDLKGSESYELQPSGAYRFEAEYASGEGLSNQIRGEMSPFV